MHTSRKFLSAAALAGLLAIGTLATDASADPSRAPRLPEAFVGGTAAIERAGERLPEIAARYGMKPGELRRMLLTDATLGMDRSRRLAYFDEPEPANAETISAETTAVADIPLSDAFALSSAPGADKTIHLDFDGHVTTGTTWNSASGRTSISSPPYTRDADTSTFSAEERRIIIDTWAVVAEDFAPWNVNVTTIDPGTDDLRRSGTGDTRWGVRVVITGDDWDNCGCGGFAYLGSFDDSADEPVFVFNNSFAGVSEATSHEVGHALLLNHDGATGTTYYRGHDTTGTPGWAPIMGASYYEPVTQWSKQEYAGATNTGEDDLAIIGSLANGNDFGLRPDDHGNDAGSATPLTSQQVDESGVIETRADVDVFVFTTGGGDVTFDATGADVGPNLDIALTLRNAGGGIVAQGNVIDGLDAGIAATLAAGTYTIEVDGVGVGNPFVSPPSGYTDYASIGQYTLTGFVPNVDTPEPDTTAPAAPSGVSATHAGGDVTITWSANSEPDLAGYTILRSASPAGPFSNVGTATAGATSFVDRGAPTGTHHYVVRASDLSGNVSGNSVVASVDVPEPPVVLTRTATGETTITGSVSGTFDATTARGGAVQTITEIDSGGRPDRRHDLAEHRWTIPASVGNQTLTVVASASGGGDGDTGFAIEYSTDGSTWVPFGVVQTGPSVQLEGPVGTPTGTVHVRAVDTDHSRGNTAHNSLSVDFLQITGDGAAVQPPTATMVVASVATGTEGAGKGLQYAVATVSVSNDLGAPVGGASVTVRFAGDVQAEVTGTTDGSGTVTLRATEAAKRPVFTACVSSLTGTGLPYQQGSEHCSIGNSG